MVVTGTGTKEDCESWHIYCQPLGKELTLKGGGKNEDAVSMKTGATGWTGLRLGELMLQPRAHRNAQKVSLT